MKIKRFSVRRKKLWKSFSSFSEESSIHSMNYIGMKNIHWIERLFWVVCFSVCFSVCTFMIYQTYLKWCKDPVLVTFNERYTPIWKIPIPAVTICPESKVNLQQFNLTEKLSLVNDLTNLSEDDLMKLNALGKVCDSREFEKLMADESMEYKESFNIRKTLMEMSPNFGNESFVQLFGESKNIDENSLILTESGVCYTFNMLDQSDLYEDAMTSDLKYPRHGEKSNWTSFGYKNDELFDVYPNRMLKFKASDNLVFRLRIRKKDVNYACKGAVNGFRMTLHTPSEFPRTADKFYRIPFNDETLVSIIPKGMSTSENLRDYHPQDRGCFYEKERKLKYFKHYTQANCEIECLARATVRLCRCAEFWMPQKNVTEQCGISNLGCSSFAAVATPINDLVSGSEDNKHWTELIESVSQHILNKTRKNSTKTYSRNPKPKTPTMKECNCLPACSSVEYDAEISHSTMDFAAYMKDFPANLRNEHKNFEYAVIRFSFKNDQFIESKRSELYGWLNFLSSCGGFMGLLMGGSLLSLVEIFYYITLRNIFKKGNKKKRKENESFTKRNEIESISIE